MDWSIRLHDGRLIRGLRTEGKNAGEIRRRAKKHAKELLRTNGMRTAYTGRSKISTYIDDIGIAEVESADLRPHTITQYRRVLRLVSDEMKGHTIASGWQTNVLDATIKTIAGKNGAEAARHASTLSSRYVTQPLMRDRLIEVNPLLGYRIRYKDHVKTQQSETPDNETETIHGRAVAADEMDRVITYLLTLDPAEGVIAPTRGRWGIEVKIARRIRLIDLMLLQIGAAPRLNEALQLRFEHLQETADGVLRLRIPKAISKTRQARDTPLADQRIIDYFRERKSRISDQTQPIVPAPADEAKQWIKSGSTGASSNCATFYPEIGKAVDVPLLAQARTHVWRSTLSKRYEEAGISRDYIASILGHSAETNEKYYTDRTDLNQLVNAYRTTHTPDARASQPTSTPTSTPTS